MVRMRICVDTPQLSSLFCLFLQSWDILLFWLFHTLCPLLFVAIHPISWLPFTVKSIHIHVPQMCLWAADHLVFLLQEPPTFRGFRSWNSKYSSWSQRGVHKTGTERRRIQCYLSSLPHCDLTTLTCSLSICFPQRKDAVSRPHQGRPCVIITSRDWTICPVFYPRSCLKPLADQPKRP